MDYIYRMTHIDNIPHILSFGITHKSSPNANPNYVSVGNQSIIGKRHNRLVSTVDGEIFNPGDFIPFYFYVRMPMLYCIKNGYGVPPVNQEYIVYLVVPVGAIVANPSLRYFFSDAHAIWGGTKFYGSVHIQNIDSIVDKGAIVNDDWGSDNIVKERKQAEFLVSGDIPAENIFAVCCYNENAKNRLLAMGMKCPIHITPKAYY